MVLQSIYSHGAYSRKALAFHLTSPLLEQRERFLLHLHKEGATQRTLKRVEQGLLKTIRCFGLKKLRNVGVEEVQRVCTRWQRRNHANWTPDFFSTAKRWLRFHDRLRFPSPPRDAYLDKVATSEVAFCVRQRYRRILFVQESDESVESGHDRKCRCCLKIIFPLCRTLAVVPSRCSDRYQRTSNSAISKCGAPSVMANRSANSSRPRVQSLCENWG